jgi:hypothetical protein
LDVERQALSSFIVMPPCFISRSNNQPEPDQGQDRAHAMFPNKTFDIACPAYSIGFLECIRGSRD